MNKKQKNQWICFKTNSKEEFFAKSSLLAKGFEVLLPYYNKNVFHARKRKKVPYPLFPSYGFLKYDGKISSLYKIRYCHGIKYYLQYSNGQPKIISQDVINTIEYLKQKDGSYCLDPGRFKPGDEVNIVEGVLSGMRAIVKERVDECRAKLLINLLGRVNIVNLNMQVIEQI